MPEKLIARACRSTDASGTTGGNLVRGARRLGFEARIVNAANLRTVEGWLTHDLPVIVDWMSASARRPARAIMPCGHYSVVCGLDAAHIDLQDPRDRAAATPPSSGLLNLWHDFVDVWPSQRDLILRR